MRNFTKTGYRSAMFDTFMKMIPIDKQMAILEVDEYSWATKTGIAKNFIFNQKFPQNRASCHWLPCLPHVVGSFDDSQTQRCFGARVGQLRQYNLCTNYWLQPNRVSRCHWKERRVDGFHHRLTAHHDCRSNVRIHSPRRVQRKSWPDVQLQCECQRRTCDYWTQDRHSSQKRQRAANHPHHWHPLRSELHGWWLGRLPKSNLLPSLRWNCDQSSSCCWPMGRLPRKSMDTNNFVKNIKPTGYLGLRQPLGSYRKHSPPNQKRSPENRHGLSHRRHGRPRNLGNHLRWQPRHHEPHLWHDERSFR